MKVLFVCSGKNGRNRIVDAQAMSLRSSGTSVKVFYINGNGLLGYLRAILPLCVLARRFAPDLIHAHYSLCGIIAAFCFWRPVIVSLMGSDIKCGGLLMFVLKCYSRYIWKVTIVKSEEMKRLLDVYDVIILPNGVDTEVFHPMSRDDCRYELKWSKEDKIALFAADPIRPEKDYTLAREAVFRTKCCKLQPVFNVDHMKMPVYYNAADILLLTSKWEGSPNVVKEAMACGLPIVATDVGDVRMLLDGLAGSYVCNHDSVEVSGAILDALLSKRPTLGPAKLTELGLDSVSIAERILSVYKSILGD